MQYDVHSEPVRSLLIANRAYRIPRYQREYSWGKSQRATFMRDLLKQLTFDSDGFHPSSYFLGIVLFEGGREDSSVDVVDGQQRLTAITLALSAIRDTLKEIGSSDSLIKAQIINEKYIIHTNDDGEVLAVLQPQTSNPFFIRRIQDPDNCIMQDRQPEDSEEQLLSETYNWFKDNIRIDSLKKSAGGTVAEGVCEKNYIDFLCAFRDQILGADLITVFSPDRTQANAMFENLNSKGLPLSPLDLIKNSILSQLKPATTTNDEAAELWNGFKNSFVDTTATFDDFFFDYWRVTHPAKSTTRKNLYARYLEEYEDSSEEQLEQLLSSIDRHVSLYKEIIDPDANNYRKQQDRYQERYLIFLNKIRVTQTRLPILALMSCPHKVRAKEKRELLALLSNFSFAAFGLQMGINGNKLTTPFRDYIKALNSSKSTAEIQAANKALGHKLVSLLDRDAFVSSFTQLEYSKRPGSDDNRNIAANYALHEIANHLDGREGNDPHASIEHILDESSNADQCCNVGNLVVLETKINNDIDQQIRKNPELSPIDIKREAYRLSGRRMARDAGCRLDSIKTLEEVDVPRRASDLAAYFWDMFLAPYETQ